VHRAVLIGPTYPYRGGIAHYTSLLFEALRREDIDTLLVSFSRQYPRWLYPGASDKDNSETPARTVEANYWLDSVNPWTWISVFRRIRRFGPTRLILQWWTGYWGLVWLTLLYLNRWLLKCPVTIICHNVVPHDSRVWERWLAQRVLLHADRCVVHTEAERNRLNQLVPYMPVSVVPMPPFDLFLRYRTRAAVARTQLGIPNGVPVVLFFGIVRPYKGLQDLLRAMPAILTEAPSALLVVAGEFWVNRSEYDSMIAKLGIRDNVTIDDRYIPDDEVGLYFSAADLAAFPYLRASGSAALQTAISFGLPIVATDAVRSERLDNVSCVHWTATANPNALAKAISEQLQQSRDNCNGVYKGSGRGDLGWAELAKQVMKAT